MAESLNAGEACILHQKLAKLLSDSQYLLKHLELNLPPPPFLVCPVCLDLLNSPRVLPCTHVLCSACILGMTKAAKEDDWGRPRAIQGNFTCPVCRREVEWEELGKIGDNQTIAKTVQEWIEQRRDHVLNALGKRIWNCSKHVCRAGIWCAQCQTNICKECEIDGSHMGHTCHAIEDFEEYCKTRATLLEALHATNEKLELVAEERDNAFAQLQRTMGDETGAKADMAQIMQSLNWNIGLIRDNLERELTSKFVLVTADLQEAHQDFQSEYHRPKSALQLAMAYLQRKPEGSPQVHTNELLDHLEDFIQDSVQASPDLRLDFQREAEIVRQKLLFLKWKLQQMNQYFLLDNCEDQWLLPMHPQELENRLRSLLTQRWSNGYTLAHGPLSHFRPRPTYFGNPPPMQPVIPQAPPLPPRTPNTTRIPSRIPRATSQQPESPTPPTPPSSTQTAAADGTTIFLSSNDVNLDTGMQNLSVAHHRIRVRVNTSNQTGQQVAASSPNGQDPSPIPSSIRESLQRVRRDIEIHMQRDSSVEKMEAKVQTTRESAVPESQPDPNNNATQGSTGRQRLVTMATITRIQQPAHSMSTSPNQNSEHERATHTQLDMPGPNGQARISNLPPNTPVLIVLPDDNSHTSPSITPPSQLMRIPVSVLNGPPLTDTGNQGPATQIPTTGGRGSTRNRGSPGGSTVACTPSSPAVTASQAPSVQSAPLDGSTGAGTSHRPAVPNNPLQGGSSTPQVGGSTVHNQQDSPSTGTLSTTPPINTSLSNYSVGGATTARSSPSLSTDENTSIPTQLPSGLTPLSAFIHGNAINNNRTNMAETQGQSLEQSQGNNSGNQSNLHRNHL